MTFLAARVIRHVSRILIKGYQPDLWWAIYTLVSCSYHSYSLVTGHISYYVHTTQQPHTALAIPLGIDIMSSIAEYINIKTSEIFFRSRTNRITTRFKWVSNVSVTIQWPSSVQYRQYNSKSLKDLHITGVLYLYSDMGPEAPNLGYGGSHITWTPVE